FRGGDPDDPLEGLQPQLTSSRLQHPGDPAESGAILPEDGVEAVSGQSDQAGLAADPEMGASPVDRADIAHIEALGAGVHPCRIPVDHPQSAFEVTKPGPP